MNDKHTFSPGSRMPPQHDNEALHLHLDEQERCNVGLTVCVMRFCGLQRSDYSV